MGTFAFIAILLIIFVVLPGGIGLLVYYIPKKLGYAKTAKYVTIIYGLLLLICGFLIIFEDALFTKNDAKELVEEQEIRLKDDFELLANESHSAIGDYYHTFTLKISARDRIDAIRQIRNSKNFNSVEEGLFPPYTHSRYFGPKVTWNYEDEFNYTRAYFKPAGREGYAPTHRRIQISKTANELTFEDIDD